MILKEKNLKNVVLLPSARKEELSVYLMLKDHLFKNKTVYIGDCKIPKQIVKNNNTNDFTDIFTKDKKIGLEVVTYETDKNYYVNQNFFGNLDSVRIDAETISYKSNKGSKLNHFFMQTIIQSENSLKDNEVKFHSEKIHSRIEEKLKKLNLNKYSAFDKINLALFAPISDKKIGIKNIANICKNLSKKYSKNFDNVYVLLNKKVYEIDKNFKIKTITTWQNNESFIK